MRRVLFFVLAVVLLARAEAAVACSYAPGHGPPSDEALFAMATTVFVAHLVRVEEAGVVSVDELLAAPPWVRAEPLPKSRVESLPQIPALEATFRVVEVFKGKPPADGKIRAPRWYMCFGAMIMAGMDYVFFLHEGSFIRSGLEGRHLPTGWSEHQRAEYLEEMRKLSKKAGR